MPQLTQINNNNDNSKHFHLTMNSFNNPSIDHLNDNILKDSVQSLFKTVFFNNQVPQNHVILYGPEEERNGIVKVLMNNLDNDNKIKYDSISVNDFNTKNECSLERLQNQLVDSMEKSDQNRMYEYLDKVNLNKTTEDRVYDKISMLQIAKSGHTMVENTINKVVAADNLEVLI